MAYALPMLKEPEGSLEEPEPPSGVISRAELRAQGGYPFSEPEPDHRILRDGDFWRRVPAYTHVSRTDFLDHLWQAKNSITRPEKLLDVLRGVADSDFVSDLAQGLMSAPMALRLSPYVLSLIDWNDPERDPLRRQFLPLASSQHPDHPCVGLEGRPHAPLVRVFDRDAAHAFRLRSPDRAGRSREPLAGCGGRDG
jgi:hypothetical protein